MSLSGRAAVFLDRDGTIIEDRHYLAEPDGVRLLPGAAQAIAQLNRAGIVVVLVTNQSGIGRGYFSEADFRAVQRRMLQLLAERGACMNGVYHCPHAPGVVPPCGCRKPAPGLFLRAAEEHGLDLARCYFIGDGVRDVAPAERWGATALLLRGGAAGGQEEIPGSAQLVADLAEAVDRVLAAWGSD